MHFIGTNKLHSLKVIKEKYKFSPIFPFSPVVSVADNLVHIHLDFS